MTRLNKSEWARLWAGVCELSGSFDGRLVFIGGVAVYLHVRGAGLTSGLLERSHDGDFYVALSDFRDLRDTEVVTPNRRLNKYQIFKDGVEFDVYLESRSNLLVGYTQAYEESDVFEDVRVACLEHLLVLKLDAYADRRGTPKGLKDERDIIRVCHLLATNGVKRARLSAYLTESMVELLKSVRRSPEFMAICGDNAHQARQLRDSFVTAADKVAAALNGGRR